MTGTSTEGDPAGVHYSDIAARDTNNLLLSFLEGPEESENPWAGALCAETDPEAFFPEKGESSHEAKRVCASGCPIRDFCLEFALSNKEEYGIWGGMSAVERKRLIQRTTKTSAA